MFMTSRTARPLIAAAGLLAVGAAAWAADAATTMVRGRVSAVDATAKTITLTTMGQDQTTSVLHVTDATKYLVDATGALSDLKVKSTVRVMGQTDGNTVTARMIQVLPDSEAGQTPPAGGGGGRYGVQGVIATTTPSLTITTTDNQTDTVTTDANTRISVPKDGKLDDVKANTFVTATVTGTGDNQTATIVHVRQGFGRRGGGGGQGGPNGGGAPAPTPAPPPAPAPAPGG